MAVERQKALYKGLKEEENSILAKREAIKHEFDSLRHRGIERRNFQYDNKNSGCSKQAMVWSGKAWFSKAWSG